MRGEGERRKLVDKSVEGVRQKLTSPIFMVMLTGMALSDAMVGVGLARNGLSWSKIKI